MSQLHSEWHNLQVFCSTLWSKCFFPWVCCPRSCDLLREAAWPLGSGTFPTLSPLPSATDARPLNIAPSTTALERLHLNLNLTWPATGLPSCVHSKQQRSSLHVLYERQIPFEPTHQVFDDRLGYTTEASRFCCLLRPRCTDRAPGPLVTITSSFFKFCTMPKPATVRSIWRFSVLASRRNVMISSATRTAVGVWLPAAGGHGPHHGSF